MPELPKFDSYEDLTAFLEKQSNKPLTPVKKQAKKRGPVTPDASHGLTQEASEMIYQTLHFYVRPGDNFQKLTKDARNEAKFRNSNVLVFAHDHSFSDECNPHCHQVVKEP